MDTYIGDFNYLRCLLSNGLRCKNIGGIIMTNENPLNKYYAGKFEKQRQEYPGLESEMTPVPDTGESSYKGANKLTNW